MRLAAYATMLALIFIGISFSGKAAASMDDQQLLRLIDGLHEPIRDLYLEHEGDVVLVRDDARTLLTDPLGRSVLFSGMFYYRSRDDYLDEIFQSNLATRDDPASMNHHTLLTREPHTSIFSRSDVLKGGVQARHITAADYDVQGSYGRINLIRYVRELLKYGNKRLIDRGIDTVGGRPCNRYTFVLGTPPYDPDDERSLTHTFWIDLARNANVVRRESFVGSRPMVRTVDIVLEPFETPGGQVWLPASGKLQGFDSDGDEIVVEENHHVLVKSIKLNQGLGDARFTVDHPMDTPISDQLKSMVREAGQDSSPPPQSADDAEARLDEALRRARDMGTELSAASSSRGGSPSWLFWLPFGLFAACAAVAVALKTIRR